MFSQRPWPDAHRLLTPEPLALPCMNLLRPSPGTTLTWTLSVVGIASASNDMVQRGPGLTRPASPLFVFSLAVCHIPSKPSRASSAVHRPPVAAASLSLMWPNKTFCQNPPGFPRFGAPCRWPYAVADDFFTKQLPFNVTWGLTLLYALDHQSNFSDPAVQVCQTCARQAWQVPLGIVLGHACPLFTNQHCKLQLP